MGKRGSTYGKRDRERAKKAKAAAKRARRHARPDDDEATEESGPATSEARRRPDLDEAEVIERLARVHERYDAGQITFRQFEEQKQELTALLEIS